MSDRFQLAIKSGKVLGIVTDRDIVLRSVASGNMQVNARYDERNMVYANTGIWMFARLAKLMD